MKKYLVPIALLTVLASCSSSGSDSSSTDSSSASSSAVSASSPSDNPDYKKGLALVASNDCLGCHKVSEKLTGPAYQDVANKYDNTEANVTMLADKIIKGGSGVWGTVPMTPHPAVSEADAQQMVKYILLLKK